jgi:hypothetical protein
MTKSAFPSQPMTEIAPHELQAWADEAQACIDSGEVVITDHRKADATVTALRSHASLKARIQDLEAALQIAQELFAIVVNPQDHPNTSVQHLWAQCKEIECKIRDLLQPKDGAK